MDDSKKKISFIINPISGTQGKEQILKWLDEKLDKSRYIPEVIYTERAGHAVEIAALKAKEEAFAVVAIGGDGTINEIARSLVHTKTALGIIPCGSGNGLARHLQIPMDAKKAINIINEGLIDIIDYGKINDVPFFCTCGVGFDAFVSLQFSKAGKRGPLIYLEKTLLESLKYKPETYELEMDGSTLRYKAFLIACGNASQYGNNAYITPQATLNDGLLDVTILEPFTVLDVPALSFQLFNKTIDQNSRIKTFRCKTLRIHRSKQGYTFRWRSDDNGREHRRKHNQKRIAGHCAQECGKRFLECIAACPGLHQWLETNKRSHSGRYYPYKQNDIG